MRRGATVTLTDMRTSIHEDAQLRNAGVQLELGGHRAGDAARGGPDRPQPRRAADAAGRRRRARRRRAGDGRAGARLALAPRPDRRDHRHQGEVDDDDADRTDARSGRPSRPRRRQHRPRAQRASRRVHRRHDPRRRSEQLPARRVGDVPSVDRGAAELLAGPSRSPRRSRGVRGGEGADLRQPDAGRLGAAQRRRRGVARAAQEAPGAPDAVRDDARSARRRARRRATRSSAAPATGNRRSCRCRR